MTPDIFDLGEHLRDGLWRVDGAALGDLRDVTGVAMVGEAPARLGARLALAAAGAAMKPVATDGGPLRGDGTLVLSMSYDGEDVAALDALAEAGRTGGRCVVATTGGALATRARESGYRVVPLPAGFTSSSAIGYWLAIVAEVLARAGVVPSLRDGLESSADRLEQLVTRWSEEGEAAPPAVLAGALHGARSLALLEPSPLGQRVADRLLTEAGLPVALVDPALLDALPLDRLEANGARLAAFTLLGAREGALALAAEPGSELDRILSTILLVDVASHLLGSRAKAGQ